MSSLGSSLILTSMALVVETTRQFRSLTELTQLVEAISKADVIESEPDWLEWKREADLGQKRWHAVIGKFITGFANRDPAVAKREAGGCAYLVIGVEPSNLLGVYPKDNAVLQNGVSRFVRETVRWNPQCIEHLGKHVLVITVEPPENGAQIAAMLKSFPGVCREGDVFIRRHGLTNLATQEDYDMLVGRFRASSGQPIALTVDSREPVTALPIEFGPDSVSTWYTEQRAMYLRPLRPPRLASRIYAPFESRSPEKFRSQVESYLEKAAPLLRQKAHADALEKCIPNMRLVLVNDTGSNYAAVRVEVTIDGCVWAYSPDVGLHPEMPDPPREWGENSFFPPISISQPFPTTELFGPHIVNDECTHIQFDDVDLRPYARVGLDPIHLVCDADVAGQTLKATWTATSTSVEGVVKGQIEIQASSDVIYPFSQ